MNRPTLENTLEDFKKQNKAAYGSDVEREYHKRLEEYCDELESKLEALQAPKEEWISVEEVKLPTWLDQSPFQKDSVITGVIVKHRNGGMWGNVGLKTASHGFAIKLEQQEIALKNIGKTVKAKPYEPSYYTVEIIEGLTPPKTNHQ
ncbi:hypothetical protein C7S20_19380 [Christiangramia fulva]|uniref:Uncharacterized protein n=1 Tax=Christiangramia fulva TaxID=2126553 RepID=A0A2R3ZAD4_9FLAO|nr:hypothetical protein [Christiangramia fulva]AVR47239.1 hypothetical protein C7S20_19380 [Christiangramia fulva]